MKIRGEVLAVETTGDKLRVRGQGDVITEAEWRPMVPFSFEVADMPRNQRAYHVGRRVTITVTPEGH